MFYRSHLLATVLFVLSPTLLIADDPVEMVKTYPPATLAERTIAEVKASVVWQIEQLDAIIEEHVNSKDVNNQRITELEVSLDELRTRVRPEFRELDKQVRSQLVGNAIEKLLDAQLELAALEQTISILESKSEPDLERADELQKMEWEIETQTAYQRYQLALSEHQKMKKLRDTGSMTLQQYERARVSTEIAKLEHEKAKARSALENERLKAEKANDLVQRRLAAAPLKSRIEAIKAFLDRVSHSAEASAKIAHVSRELEQLHRSSGGLDAEIFDLNRRKIELSTLQRLIDKRLATQQKN